MTTPIYVIQFLTKELTSVLHLETHIYPEYFLVKEDAEAFIKEHFTSERYECYCYALFPKDQGPRVVVS